MDQIVYSVYYGVILRDSRTISYVLIKDITESEQKNIIRLKSHFRKADCFHFNDYITSEYITEHNGKNYIVMPKIGIVDLSKFTIIHIDGKYLNSTDYDVSGTLSILETLTNVEYVYFYGVEYIDTDLTRL